MIYLLCAAVVVLVAVVAGQAFRLAELDQRMDFMVAYWLQQNRLNKNLKEKLRLVGQHID